MTRKIIIACVALLAIIIARKQVNKEIDYPITQPITPPVVIEEPIKTRTIIVMEKQPEEIGPDSYKYTKVDPEPYPWPEKSYLTYDKLLQQGIPNKDGSGKLWTWVWQYTGFPVDTLAHIHVLDGDSPASEFKQIMEKGSFPVAYISCSFEPWRGDSAAWKSSDKGRSMSPPWGDEKWPNEKAIKDHNSNLWLVYENRLREMATKLAPITGGRVNLCGIEWDNVDLYDSIGLGKTEGLKFLKKLKELTEYYGFIFVLKNSTEMVSKLPEVKLYINEQAQQYDEIDVYKTVGLTVPVLNVEYRRPASSPAYVYTLFYSSVTNINGKGEPIE